MEAKLKILIVEDLQLDANLIKHEINRSGIQFIDQIVETQKDYIEAIQKFSPDIILSDYYLPTFDGMQALLIRKKISPNIPFILVTGTLNEEIAVEVMKAGANDYVIKEHITRIGTAIKTALEKVEIIRLKEESEEKLKILSLAVDQNPASIVITDIQGNIEYVNPKFTLLTGYSSNDVIGKNPRILKSGMTSIQEYKNLWDTITRGGEWRGEFQNLKKNGEFYFESAWISPITDESGAITHFLAVKEDITERKNSEKKIKTLSEAIEQSPTCIIITDANGKIEFVNSKFASFVQYSLDDVKGKYPLIFNVGHNCQESYKGMWDNLKSGNIWQGEFNNRKKDGTKFWEYVIISPLLENNVISNYILVSEDITEKKKMVDNLIVAKENAEESEERFHSLFENMIEGFAYCKMIFENGNPVDFIYIEVNNSFEALTGLKNVRGKKVTELIPGIRQSDPLIFQIYGRVALTGKPERFEMYVESLNDWYSVSVYSSKKEFFIAVFDVITERKNTEKALISSKEKAEESDRLKTAFLHNISHEIRTPLNAIIGFSSLLVNSNLPPQKRKEFLKIINVSNDQLLSVISGIISLSTLDTGQEKIQEKETDINEMLTNVYDQFLVNKTNPEVTFSYHQALSDKLAVIYTDPVKLMQILINLVGNALKFTKNGKVRFGYTLETNQLNFFVEDTGIGIPTEMHELIFERFRQVDNSATRKYGGTGLGLALSKGYVELLGSKIRLQSEIGKGSVFAFTIPYKPVIKTTRQNETQSRQLSIPVGKNILVVEDDITNFVLLSKLLTMLKLNVIRAENGEVAISICCGANQPDLVLMDIKMPIMDGIEATRRIKKLNPGLIVIAVTACANENDRIQILESGCDGYIVKPINQQVLLANLEKYLTQ